VILSSLHFVFFFLPLFTTKKEQQNKKR